MNNIQRINRELFINEAYKLLNDKKSLDSFINEIGTATPKFDIAGLSKQPKASDQIIARGKFTGQNDLETIISECLCLLDGDKVDVAQCISTPKARKLEVVTSKYHIKIYRNLQTKEDALVVKHRF